MTPDPYAPPKAPIPEPAISRPIEDFLNWLSDQDWGWWPVIHLRPPKDERMTMAIVLKLSLLALLPFGLMTFYFYRRLGIYGSAMVVLVLDLFFVANAGIFATAWNRRAARLQGSRTTSGSAGA
jgi:hypothetical protein